MARRRIDVTGKIQIGRFDIAAFGTSERLEEREPTMYPAPELYPPGKTR
jgi:hypothetical protein